MKNITQSAYTPKNSMPANIKVIIVTGPTATGKTSLAVKLARYFNGEIISADSRQVYRGLDIGTGKDLEEYGTGRNTVKYHLIDICDPKEEYNLRQFNIDAKRAVYDVHSRGKIPIIAGGTALYIDSLISNYKFPVLAPDYNLRLKLKNKSTAQLAEYLKCLDIAVFEKLDNKNSRPRLIRAIEDLTSKSKPLVDKFDNISFEWLILGTLYQRKEVHFRIEKRLEERFNAGMIEEVKFLHESGVSWERLDAFGLEYRYISQYLRGMIEIEQMKSTLLAKIRRLARSQDIWFRKMERNGQSIYWLSEERVRKAIELSKLFLDNKQLPEPKIKLINLNHGKG